jgi:hypothetical protein
MSSPMAFPFDVASLLQIAEWALIRGSYQPEPGNARIRLQIHGLQLSIL